MQDGWLVDGLPAIPPAIKACLQTDQKSAILGWFKENKDKPLTEQRFGELCALLDLGQHQFNNGKRGRPKKTKRTFSRKTVEEISNVFEESVKVNLRESRSECKQPQPSHDSTPCVVKKQIERLTKLSEKKCHTVFYVMVRESLKKLHPSITDEEFTFAFGLNRKTISNNVKRFLKCDLEDGEVTFRALQDSITERLNLITIEMIPR